MSSETELALLAKVKSLEEDRVKFLDIVRNKIQKLEKELEVSRAINESRINRTYIPTNTVVLIRLRRQKQRKIIVWSNEIMSWKVISRTSVR